MRIATKSLVLSLFIVIYYTASTCASSWSVPIGLISEFAYADTNAVPTLPADWIDLFQPVPANGIPTDVDTFSIVWDFGLHIQPTFALSERVSIGIPVYYTVNVVSLGKGVLSYDRTVANVMAGWWGDDAVPVVNVRWSDLSPGIGFALIVKRKDSGVFDFSVSTQKSRLREVLYRGKDRPGKRNRSVAYESNPLTEGAWGLRFDLKYRPQSWNWYGGVFYRHAGFKDLYANQIGMTLGYAIR